MSADQQSVLDVLKDAATIISVYIVLLLSLFYSVGSIYFGNLYNELNIPYFALSISKEEVINKGFSYSLFTEGLAVCALVVLFLMGGLLFFVVNELKTKRILLLLSLPALFVFYVYIRFGIEGYVMNYIKKHIITNNHGRPYVTVELVKKVDEELPNYNEALQHGCYFLFLENNGLLFLVRHPGAYRFDLREECHRKVREELDRCKDCKNCKKNTWCFDVDQISKKTQACVDEEQKRFPMAVDTIQLSLDKIQSMRTVPKYLEPDLNKCSFKMPQATNSTQILKKACKPS
ncbi:MAG: hypothetical protein HQM01_01505 [Magnetococcales bacterium]|nr:hypothetical protein [Magnetococcales bacterium]